MESTPNIYDMHEKTSAPIKDKLLLEARPEKRDLNT